MTEIEQVVIGLQRWTLRGVWTARSHSGLAAIESESTGMRTGWVEFVLAVDGVEKTRVPIAGALVLDSPASVVELVRRSLNVGQLRGLKRDGGFLEPEETTMQIYRRRWEK